MRDDTPPYGPAYAPQVHGKMIAMDSHRKALRALISSMAPKRATAFIQSFDLPDEETECLILCIVHKQSCVQAADKLCLSPETIRRRKQAGLDKMLDGLKLNTCI